MSVNLPLSLKTLFLAICLCTVPDSPVSAQALFLNPPKIIKDPANYYQYSENSRKFTGISSLAISEGGRMWATWYAGMTSGEDKNNYVTLATSMDGGDSWEEVLVVDPDGKGPVRAYDPELWVDPDHNLWLFWAQAIGHEGTVAGVWAMQTKDPESKDAQWSAPKRLTDGIMMNKPTVLSNGDWLFPASTWRLTDNSARVLATSDKGKTWQVRGAAHVPTADRAYDEHMVVEKKDGSLWMLIRTKFGISESVSKDKGKTWSDLKASEIKHPSTRFFIRRTQAGNLLLVKHGPIGVNTSRSHLMAFISKDDGDTWSKGLLLDERTGVSYPDGQQTKDGVFYITYDFDRTGKQNILLTSFKEEDILDPHHDQALYRVFKNRKTISTGGL